MPLTGKDKEVESSMKRQYGDEGDRVFYATLNKRINEGRPINIPESKRLAAKRKHHKKKRHHKKKGMR